MHLVTTVLVSFVGTEMGSMRGDLEACAISMYGKSLMQDTAVKAEFCVF